MIIDGEELKLVCEDCGHRFTRIIGYGAICPTPMLRRRILKENPSKCPVCGSLKVKETSLFGRLKNLFG